MDPELLNGTIQPLSPFNFQQFFNFFNFNPLEKNQGRILEMQHQQEEAKLNQNRISFEQISPKKSRAQKIISKQGPTSPKLLWQVGRWQMIQQTRKVKLNRKDNIKMSKYTINSFSHAYDKTFCICFIQDSVGNFVHFSEEGVELKNFSSQKKYKYRMVTQELVCFHFPLQTHEEFILWDLRTGNLTQFTYNHKYQKSKIVITYQLKSYLLCIQETLQSSTNNRYIFNCSYYDFLGKLLAKTYLQIPKNLYNFVRINIWRDNHPAKMIIQRQDTKQISITFINYLSTGHFNQRYSFMCPIDMEKKGFFNRIMDITIIGPTEMFLILAGNDPDKPDKQFRRGFIWQLGNPNLKPIKFNIPQNCFIDFVGVQCELAYTAKANKNQCPVLAYIDWRTKKLITNPSTLKWPSIGEKINLSNSLICRDNKKFSIGRFTNEKDFCIKTYRLTTFGEPDQIIVSWLTELVPDCDQDLLNFAVNLLADQ